jgi:hypothetical protein
MGWWYSEAVQVHGDPEASVQPQEQGERGGQADPGHAPRLPDQGRKNFEIQSQEVRRVAISSSQVCNYSRTAIEKHLQLAQSGLV